MNGIARPRPFDVVVVAAGGSRRMGGIDKLDAVIGDRPLLAWTLGALGTVPNVGRIAVAVAPERVAAVAAAAWLPPSIAAIVPGGRRRQDSVAAAFDALDPPDERIVVVHDGARPAVSHELILAAIAAAERHGAAIPTLPIAETVKRLAQGRVIETMDRAALAVAQTPQAVRAAALRAAWAVNPPDGPLTFTDEAAFLEAARIPVHAIPGDPSNLKVTVPADLARVRETLLASTSPQPALADRPVRVGFGTDSHPFGPGEPLALGGTTIEGAPRLAGHSDGDVALHALADALLGAAGLPDLGRIVPAGRETPRGIAGRLVVGAAMDRLAAAGYSPLSVDLTIVGARPRLAERLDGMRDAIAGILGLPASAVDVKGSTGNLGGMEGAGRGMTAHAVAVIGHLDPSAATAMRR
ncbi:MAG: 2-C-methyl-D-erythritol 2,4-cyclodiphosphate synthase [Chloroflexi bacterium]|nr:2-C-methyl-D-erythritol 2,4-cyclodiphosphate synthase [Chloroflexota bacterium]